MGLCASSYKDEIKFLKDRGVTQHFINGISGWDENRLSRLRRIMNGDITVTVVDIVGSEFDTFVHVEDNTFQHYFGIFLNEQPAWNAAANNVVLFWNNYPKKFHDNILVIRKQMSGLCFMHAPVVLQHYLLCIHRINTGQPLDFKMIDIAAYIKDNWKGPLLETYLAFDHGGSSQTFFKEINGSIMNYRRHTLNKPSHRTAFNKVCAELMEELKLYPALVSNFKVSPEFHTAGVSFHGTHNLNANCKGMHSMLLIGGRSEVDESGDITYFFLLQNWWADRFFIEVSAEYLYSSEATISFVEEAVEEIPNKFVCTNSPYSETFMDTSERMDEIVDNAAAF